MEFTSNGIPLFTIKQKYTLEQKVEAVLRFWLSRQSKAEIARSVGVAESTLRGWCKHTEVLRIVQLQLDELNAKGVPHKYWESNRPKISSRRPNFSGYGGLERRHEAKPKKQGSNSLLGPSTHGGQSSSLDDNLNSVVDLSHKRSPNETYLDGVLDLSYHRRSNDNDLDDNPGPSGNYLYDNPGPSDTEEYYSGPEKRDETQSPKEQSVDGSVDSNRDDGSNTDPNDELDPDLGSNHDCGLINDHVSSSDGGGDGFNIDSILDNPINELSTREQWQFVLSELIRYQFRNDNDSVTVSTTDETSSDDHQRRRNESGSSSDFAAENFEPQALDLTTRSRDDRSSPKTTASSQSP